MGSVHTCTCTCTTSRSEGAPRAVSPQCDGSPATRSRSVPHAGAHVRGRDDGGGGAEHPVRSSAGGEQARHRAASREHHMSIFAHVWYVCRWVYVLYRWVGIISIQILDPCILYYTD